ncbi:hypothetical protein N8479_00405 [Flavobacteriaceae bacterium]|nr:hypothetical protein [Flavobacteriaceae bacterium]
MKSINIFLSIIVLSVILISCSKDEDVITIPPAVVIPPPSFVIPPVTSPEPSTPPSYDGGDISISSTEDLDYYREINVQNITGNFELNLDWTYVDNSTSDPSVFTKNIETVTGDVTINVSVNEEVSLENLVRVDGVYTVTGNDVSDESLLYAKTIELDYPGDYEIKAVYTDEVRLNLGDDQTSKSASSSKFVLRNVDVVAYHTSLLPDTDFTQANLPSIRTIAPPMPATAIYPSFVQTDHTDSSQIVSNNIGSITIGGHVNIEKITSESCTEIKINNTELQSIEVVSNSVVTFEMPNLIELVSLILNMPKVDKVEIPLLFSITNLTITGLNELSLPKLAALPTGTTFPANLRVVSSVDGIAQSGASTGSGSSGSSSTSTSDSSTHNSGGSTTHDSGGSSTHDSGGSHNSGGSGG